MTTILIIGGGAGGVSLSHQLLRKTLPSLSQQTCTNYKVVLLSPSNDFYWKVSAPRGLVNPDLIPTSESFIPIKDGFQQFDASQFEVIAGSAKELDADRKVVSALSENGELIDVPYHVVVIASGAASKSPMYCLSSSPKATKDALLEMHDRLPKAQSILVAGGGPAGIETAGELAAEYGTTKSITLVSGHDRLLPRLRDVTGWEAEKKLKQIGINIRHEVRVSAVSNTATNTTVTFSDGSEVTVEVFIDATGWKPNTAFLPKEWLDERGHVLADTPTLRLKATNAEDTYALGSVTSFSNGSFFDVIDAIPALAESIRLDQLRKAKTLDIQPGWLGWLWGTDHMKRRVNYVPRPGEIQFIPCGRDGGVGEFYGWRIPSFAIYHIKGKTFMMESARPLVEGENYK